MEESKICKSCGVDKPLSMYHNNKHCVNNKVGVCKICKQKGILTVRTKPHKFNLDRLKNPNYSFRLTGVSPDDFKVMYDLIKTCGYDVEGDVHQQFLDKWNPISKKPMKYKKRGEIKNLNVFLPNGERNPLKTRNPTD